MAPKNQVKVIAMDEAEKAGGALSPFHMMQAVQAIHDDGVVVIEGATDLEHVDIVNQAMVDDLPNLLREKPPPRYNPAMSGNVAQCPPLGPGLIFEDLYDNKIAVSVLQNVLGPRVWLTYLRGNTAKKNSHGRQKVHADVNFPHANFPFGMVVNIMFCDATLDNGTTELWLGTHKTTTMEDHEEPNVGFIKQSVLDERRKTVPPIRPFIKKGSVIIRDLRMFHAGISNSTDVDRIMLSLVYFPDWYKNRALLNLPMSAKPYFSNFTNATAPAKYVDDKDYDYYTYFFADFKPGHELAV